MLQDRLIRVCRHLPWDKASKVAIRWVLWRVKTLKWETKCNCPPGQPQGHSEQYDAIFCRTCLQWVETPAGYPDRPETAEDEK